MASQRLRNMFSHVRTGSTGGAATDSAPKAKAQEAQDTVKEDSNATAAPEPQIPAFDDLPKFKDMPGCAWGVWGPDDQLGTVNLLTDKDPLPYDPWTTHAITVADLEACAAAQGVTFRQGDILILRVGFIQKYYAVAQEERDSLGAREETFAGIEQSEDMKRFLWCVESFLFRRCYSASNNHFAAIASDQPALERWPTPEGVPHMHQTLLGLWGMPIGEFFDLEKLAAKCAETGRYTFFFSSWPLNIIGGCASPPNAAVASPLEATMSRRESRVSMGARQNDALLEFENFKKKFLLANKHITKLNSTLSTRIEELNAQISSLYVENLRLRASEIALAAQLKREREKSRKIMAEAEAATLNLTKHLGYLRQSFNISAAAPSPASPPSPRARKPPLTVNADPTSSPQVNRLSRPPNVPGIFEEDEPLPSSSDQEEDKPPSPVLKKTKTKSRLSASRLPLPSRVTSPPPLPQPTGDDFLAVEEPKLSKPRKPTRRQSGLLNADMEGLTVPRAPSPAFGSPIRRAAGLAEEEEEMAVVANQLVGTEVDVDMEKPPPKKERRKSRGKEQETAEEPSLIPEGTKPRERKRKERTEGEIDGGGKPPLKDVTNPRAALVSIDNTVPTPPPARAFLTASPTPSAPTSRGSSSPTPGESEGPTGGRERRARKSVNYAEPKLNTKMRKPDPPPGTVDPPKKRASAAAILTTYRPPEDTGNDADNDTEARSSLEIPLRMNANPINPESLPLPPSRPPSAASLFSPPPAQRSSVKRKKSRPVLDDEDSDGAQADAEYGVGNTWANVDVRRRGTGSGTSGTSSNKRGITTLDDPRRHSMAV
ncbi:hypothetical protein H0H92_012359 [Tricholoma furcatifolium]|nr:hypothetical protein H0H92_012359 [Tricholoma furcatifolium]